MAQTTNAMTGIAALPAVGVAHVWRFQVSREAANASHYERLLSAEERTIAGRFMRSSDRLRYVVAHGALRQVLGRYLAEEPGELEFARDAFGKPRLVRGAGRAVVSFNLSHSGDWVICGLVRGGRIGVDVEEVRADFDELELARNRFSREENAILAALEPAERRAAFFRCWTRKEAYLKARGQGLSGGLDQFAVAFAPNDIPRILWAADEADAPTRWAVFDVPLEPGHAAAVVAEQPLGQVEHYDSEDLRG